MPKLHLPLSESFPNRPLCGRQLNNHRADRNQASDRVAFAQSGAEFNAAILGLKNGQSVRPFGCRHCGYVSGLLVRTITVRESGDEDESGDE